MAHIKVIIGKETDILFRLRNKTGGALTDDDQWVDGSTAGEWPAVTFKTQGGADVTATWVKNIAGDSVAPKQKHPDPGTGIIRDNAVGEYRVRVQPSASAGTYLMRVVADIGGAPYSEEHEISLVVAGDVEFGDEGIYCTDDDVTSLFELAGVVTTPELSASRKTADDMVNSRLESHAITTPTKLIPAVRRAAVAYARGELRRLKAALSVPGNVQSVKEGDTEYRFFNLEKQALAFYAEGDRWMDMAVNAILGGDVYLSRGEWGTDR